MNMESLVVKMFTANFVMKMDRSDDLKTVCSYKIDFDNEKIVSSKN